MFYNSILVALLTAIEMKGAFAMPNSPAERTTLASQGLSIESSDSGDTWKNPKGGNTKLGMSDHRINFGTLHPNEILEHIKSKNICDSTGCDPSPFTMATKYAYKDEQVPGTVTVNINADYNDNLGGYILDAFHNTYLDSSAHVVKFINSTYLSKNSPPCGNNNNCPGPYREYQEENVAPNYMTFNIEDKANSYINIGFTKQIDIPGESGFCGAFQAIGASVSAAISAVVAAEFILAEILCAL